MTGTTKPPRSVWSRRAIGMTVLGGLSLVLALGLVLLQSQIVEQVGLGVTGLTLIVVLVLNLPAIAVIAYMDRREPEPWWVITLLFVWGAVVATGLALLLQNFGSEQLIGRFNHSAALVDTSRLGIEVVSLDSLFEWLETSLIAPITEEAVKGIAVVLVFLLLPREVNTMRDGVIVGALVGIGFAVTETTAFIISGYASSGGSAYLSQLIPRLAVLGVNGHLVFTALFGAGVGWARESIGYGKVRKGVVIVGTFLLAVAAHSMYNAFGPYAVAAFASIAGWGPTITGFQLWVLSLLEVLATYGWAYLVLIYFLIESGYRELDVIRTELQHELPVTVTPEEYSLAEGERLWRMRRLPGLGRHQSIRMVRAQNRLAFQRDEVRREDGDLDNDPLVVKRRRHVRAIREALRSH